MIKFFRHIRKNLMEQNKTSKYLKYAIGEIILVVIGILIALSINNWNESLKERQLEAYYLEQIHDEFLSNKEQFDLIISIHKRSYRSAQWLLDNAPFDSADIDSLRKHIDLYRYSFTYNPSQSSISTIINNGHLNLLTDKKLRNTLVKWNELILDYKEEETYNRNYYDNMIAPFGIKHFTLYSKRKEERFDNVLTFDQSTMHEFLNIVATKRRLLNQIVDNKELEYLKVKQSIDFILEKTADYD
ncbi:DUF6090 family protein [Winogradskyella sp.]|uniref:DUF6090 family protein n=1 Tax=Winogradskyella sp. TaxID=1883156 RepID=UPI001B14F6DC|nr:DUF6090 family protein [Winogradskyella sp.]MBO6879521.1 hypothetical protein [Winogradskyella sp.]